MIDKELLKNLTTEQKQELLDQLMSSLSDATQEVAENQTEQEVPANTINENFRVTTTKTNKQLEKGRTPVRARKNQWVDDGKFQLENDEEWSRGRKRIDRNRTKAKKVELECSVCGKMFMEHPSLVYGEYHRCNRCGGR